MQQHTHFFRCSDKVCIIKNALILCFSPVLTKRRQENLDFFFFFLSTNPLLLLCARWGHCVTSYGHMWYICESSEHPSWQSAWDSRVAAPHLASITTQFHVKHQSQDIVVDAMKREVTKMACCFKDGAQWHDPSMCFIFHVTILSIVLSNFSLVNPKQYYLHKKRCTRRRTAVPLTY